MIVHNQMQSHRAAGSYSHFPDQRSMAACQRKEQKVTEVEIIQHVRNHDSRVTPQMEVPDPDDVFNSLLTSCRPSLKNPKIFSEFTRVRKALKQRR